MLALVRENLDWYIINGVIGEEAAAKIDDEHDEAVKAYVPYMNTVIDALGCPTDASRIGPIARDYVAFNSQPDAENLDSSGPIFDFRKTGIPRPRL